MTKRRSEAVMLRESVEDFRHTLLNAHVDAEVAMLTREEICALQRCEKSYFYASIEPHLDRDKDRPRYTRASYEAWVRSRLVNPKGEPLYKREARRKPGAALTKEEANAAT